MLDNKRDWLSIKNDFICSGMTVQDIATKYGVNRSYLSRTITEKGWREEKKRYETEVTKRVTKKSQDEDVKKELRRLADIKTIEDRIIELVEGALKKIDINSIVSSQKIATINSDGDKTEITIDGAKTIKQLTSALKDLKEVTAVKEDEEAEESGVIVIAEVKPDE